MNKRFKENLNRDDYWMGMALMLSAGSTSSNPQGCILLGFNQEPISMSYDGSKNSSEHPVHAEMKAILNCKSWDNNSTAYITCTPCYHCVVNLLAANIKRIVYFPTADLDQDSVEALKCANAQANEFCGNLNWMRDYLKIQEIFI